MPGSGSAKKKCGSETLLQIFFVQVKSESASDEPAAAEAAAGEAVKAEGAEIIPPSAAQIQEMLKKTQQMIEERKK